MMARKKGSPPWLEDEISVNDKKKQITSYPNSADPFYSDCTLRKVKKKWALVWRGGHSKEFNILQLRQMAEDLTVRKEVRCFLVHFLDEFDGFVK